MKILKTRLYKTNYKKFAAIGNKEVLIHEGILCSTTKNNLPYWIIISETERKEIKDNLYNELTKEIFYIVDKETLQLMNEQSFRSDDDKFYKILAFQEDLPPGFIQGIKDHHFKNGDKVLIECEIHDEWLKENPPFSGPYDNCYYQIKYDQDDQVSLYFLDQENYDSTPDTLKHILRVQELIFLGIQELMERARLHDQSKLKSPEKELYDKLTPLLKDLKYGSEEYKESLRELKPAIEHHYIHNTHHPEHYENGINGFDLFDLIECFFDWKASGERNKGGNIYESIDINKDRFLMSDQLVSIFKNTAKKLKF